MKKKILFCVLLSVFVVQQTYSVIGAILMTAFAVNGVALVIADVFKGPPISASAAPAAAAVPQYPLHTAAAESDANRIDQLVRQGGPEGDVNRTNLVGVTPLIIACRNGRDDIVRRLLSHGATVDYPDNGPEVPLIHAARANSIGTVELLIFKGASLAPRSITGERFWQLPTNRRVRRVLRRMARDKHVPVRHYPSDDESSDDERHDAPRADRHARGRHHAGHPYA